MHKSQDQLRWGWITCYYKSILPLTGSTTRQYYSYSYYRIYSLKACFQGVPRDLKTTVVEFSLWYKVLPNTEFLSEAVRFSCPDALPMGKCYSRHPLISLILGLLGTSKQKYNSNSCSSQTGTPVTFPKWMMRKKYLKFSLLFGLMKRS